jgi:glutathione S-transferase
MPDEIVFYTHPMSRGRIVRWMLEEIGQPYRTEVLEYGGAMKTSAFRALNPLGKVPVIRHGDVVVTEAGAICAYLADAFPEAHLAPPPGDRSRGPYYRWMFFIAGPFEAVIVNQALGVQVPEERKAMVGYGSLAEVLDALEGAVSRTDYVTGDRFTAADVYVGSHIALHVLRRHREAPGVRALCQTPVEPSGRHSCEGHRRRPDRPAAAADGWLSGSVWPRLLNEAGAPSPGSVVTQAGHQDCSVCAPASVTDVGTGVAGRRETASAVTPK